MLLLILAWISYLILVVSALELSAPSSVTSGQAFAVTWTRSFIDLSPTSFDIRVSGGQLLTSVAGHGQTQGTASVTLSTTGVNKLEAYYSGTQIPLFLVNTVNVDVVAAVVSTKSATTQTTAATTISTTQAQETTSTDATTTAGSNGSSDTSSTTSTATATEAADGTSSTQSTAVTAETGSSSADNSNSVATTLEGLSGSVLLSGSQTFATTPSQAEIAASSTNAAGSSSTTAATESLTTSGSKSHIGLIIGLIIGLLLLVFLLLVLVFFLRRRRRRSASTTRAWTENFARGPARARPESSSTFSLQTDRFSNVGFSGALMVRQPQPTTDHILDIRRDEPSLDVLAASALPYLDNKLRMDDNRAYTDEKVPIDEKPDNSEEEGDDYDGEMRVNRQRRVTFKV